MDELFDPQSSPFLNLQSQTSNLKSAIEIYSSFLAGFFFDAFLVAGFSTAFVSVFEAFAAVSAFGAAFFARGAAAAPPRFRPLLAASFAGLASTSTAVPFALGCGFASLLNLIVT